MKWSVWELRTLRLMRHDEHVCTPPQISPTCTMTVMWRSDRSDWLICRWNVLTRDRWILEATHLSHVSESCWCSLSFLTNKRMNNQDVIVLSSQLQLHIKISLLSFWQFISPSALVSLSGGGFSSLTLNNGLHTKRHHFCPLCSTWFLTLVDSVFLFLAGNWTYF